MSDMGVAAFTRDSQKASCMRLCYVFSRYARWPSDGKQHAFWRQLPIFEEIFDEVHVLGLARSHSALEGARPQVGSRVFLAEQVLAGSYSVQCFAALLELRYGVGALFARGIRKWVRSHYDSNSLVFLEGAPLVGLAPQMEAARMFFGEVDSLLRRAKRFATSSRGAGLRDRLSIAGAAALEASSIKRVKRLHVYSEQDARYLRRVHGLSADRVMAIPMPLTLPCSEPAWSRDQREELKIVVWADGKYLHLERGLRDMLCELSSVKSDKMRILFLVGRNPRLAQDVLAAGFDAAEHSDSIDQLLDEHHVVVIPDVVGTGIKNRTLHAMGRSRCVVGTRFAWEGIPYANGRDGLRADSASLIVKELRQLSLDLARSIGLAAGRTLRQNYGTEASTTAWKRFFS